MMNEIQIEGFQILEIIIYKTVLRSFLEAYPSILLLGMKYPTANEKLTVCKSGNCAQDSCFFGILAANVLYTI